MSFILRIAGVIVILASIVISFVTPTNFLGFIIIFIGCVIHSMLFFGLAAVLDNQEDILAKLQSQYEQLRKPPEKITCTRCEKEYDNSYSGCPHCAFKPGK